MTTYHSDERFQNHPRKNAEIEEVTDQEEDTDIVYPMLQDAMKAAVTLSRFYRYRETIAFNEFQNIYNTTESIYFTYINPNYRNIHFCIYCFNLKRFYLKIKFNV